MSTRIIALNSIVLLVSVVVAAVAFSASSILTICMSVFYVVLNSLALYWILMIGKFPRNLRWFLAGAQVTYTSYQLAYEHWLVGSTYHVFCDVPEKSF